MTYVEREQTHVDEERQAYEHFHSEVASLSPQTPTNQSRNKSVTGKSISLSKCTQSHSAESNACRIRELFAETIRPYSVADIDTEETLLETVQEELGDSIAFVLAPGTDVQVTTQIQQTICSVAQYRQRELNLMAKILEQEYESIQAATHDFQTISNWVKQRNQSSLQKLGFDELQHNHEKLSSHRSCCEDRLYARQETIQATRIGQNAQISRKHQPVVTYLYQELPVTYPILSTITRLDMLLADCQRTIRDHLTRRM